MKTIKGDLIQMAKQGHFDVICHGANCFCVMGAGIAKQIKYEYPEACIADRMTIKGDNSKLGTISYTHDIDGVIVVNAYTQYGYGRGGINCDYNAIRSCMKIIKEKFSDKRIGLPLIGAGLAGGDWNIIKQIIEEELKGMDVTIVEFDK